MTADFDWEENPYGSAQVFAKVRCVGEGIATFYPPEFFLCQVEAARELTLVFCIAHQELAIFSFLNG
ncbi:MAG: hypothetical protein ISP80_07285 [Synechococcus sp. BS301-5m-G53]|nr:hypothetical protein [Synechococcus sp. BS301-5m-G53]